MRNRPMERFSVTVNTPPARGRPHDGYVIYRNDRPAAWKPRSDGSTTRYFVFVSRSALANGVAWTENVEQGRLFKTESAAYTQALNAGLHLDGFSVMGRYTDD